MRVLNKTVTLILIFIIIIIIIIFAATPSTAEIKSIKIRTDDRPMIMFQKFGFTNTGNITVFVSAVSVTSYLSMPDPSRLGFFLLSEESIFKILFQLQQNPNFCVLDSKFISLVSTFSDVSPPPQSSLHKSFAVTDPNEYSLFFASCNPESLVTMDVRTELYNTDEGATKDYLSIGLTQLPSVYFIFSLIYLCFLGVWISVCFRNQRSVHQVHLLMDGLLIVKMLSLFCAAENNYYVKVTGTPHGWNVLFYLFQFVTGLISFTLIVLIGAGWLNLKPTLQGKEKKVLMTVIALQVLANVASVVIGETGPFLKDWVTWNQVFLLTDIICCCAVIFSVISSTRSLSKTDEKDVRKLATIRLLFCIMVIGYLLFTRIGVFALKMIVGNKNQWMCSGAEEIAGLVFYFVMFYTFRPVEEDEYSLKNDESDYVEAPEMTKV